MKLLWACCTVVSVIVIYLLVANSAQFEYKEPITYQRFDEMLKHHDVDRVVTYKSGDLLIAEVFLKTGSLDKPEYHDAQRGKNTAQYQFTAATYDGLVKGVDEAENAAHFTDAEKITVSIEPGHESLISNWLVQCIIMLIMLAIPVICGYIGFTEGKNRLIGSTSGLWLGILFGPFGLIFVFVSQKKPTQKSGGIRV